MLIASGWIDDDGRSLLRRVDLHIIRGAVSYIPMNRYVILPGDPLCDPSQYTSAPVLFLRLLEKETHLKPIWVLVGDGMEEKLGSRFGWNTLTCAAEERVDRKEDAEKEHEVAYVLYTSFYSHGPLL